MRKNRLWGFAREKLFGGHLEFRVRLFNVLATAGTAISLYAAVAGIRDGWPSVLACLLGAGLSVGLMVFASRTKRYIICYVVTIIAIFLGLFPVLFFMGGGYAGSMPLVFILAVVFTVIMLEKKIALFAAALELMVYVGLCVFAYQNPETIRPFQAEEQLFLDMSFGIVAVGITLALTVWFQFRLYNRQQKQLEDANRRLSELDRIKTEFLQDIKHEMRTPLTAISLGTDVALGNLGAAGNEEKARNALRTVQREALRLGRMMNGMVELANMGDKPQNRERIDFAAMLARQAEAARFELETGRNRLRVDIAADLPDIYAEAEQIERVSANLLDNAADFTQDGEIVLEASAEENHITVRVRDTGTGIPPELLPRVFERGVSGRGGNGYGLSYCKTIVEAHGGAIDIRSERGGGTTVTFTIPVYGGQDYRAE